MRPLGCSSISAICVTIGGLMIGGGMIGGCGEAKPIPVADPPASIPSAATATSTSSGLTEAGPIPPALPQCDKLAVDIPAVDEKIPIHAADPSIEFPGALDHFYAALARLARHSAKDHVRIGVFGDSNLTMDFSTGHLRRLLQARFGDGGHGYVALGKPWSHYRHMDVEHNNGYSWQAYAISTSPIGDPYYGLAGIAIENTGGDGSTFVATAKEGAPVGTRAGRFDLFYLERPKAGSFKVKIDQQDQGTVETAGEAISLGRKRFTSPDGPHRLDVIPVDKRIRVFGVALERETPGVVIDTFGVGSLNTLTQVREDPGLMKQMLVDRNYDLLIYMTGANDIMTMKDVPEAIHKLIATQREALPEVSFLILTPADRGKDKSLDLTIKVAHQRREIAEAEHGAFWSLLDAMGGENSMGGFVRAKLAYDDAVHFTDDGGAFVADRLNHALLEGFFHYLEAHPRAGCDEADPPAKN